MNEESVKYSAMDGEVWSLKWHWPEWSGLDNLSMCKLTRVDGAGDDIKYIPGKNIMGHEWYENIEDALEKLNADRIEAVAPDDDDGLVDRDFK